MSWAGHDSMRADFAPRKRSARVGTSPIEYANMATHTSDANDLTINFADSNYSRNKIAFPHQVTPSDREDVTKPHKGRISR